MKSPLGLDLYIAGFVVAIGRGKDVVADAPVVLQRTETICEDSCIVYIDVYTIATRNKAIASLGIEPFDTSLHSQKF